MDTGVTYFSSGLSPHLGSAHDVQSVIELFVHLSGGGTAIERKEERKRQKVRKRDRETEGETDRQDKKRSKEERERKRTGKCSCV